jgi:hypothetical protein
MGSGILGFGVATAPAFVPNGHIIF